MIDLYSVSHDELKEKYSYKPDQVDPALVKAWIQKGIDKNCIKYQEEIGLYLCDRINYDDRQNSYSPRNAPGNNALSNSQLRRVFGEIKRIEIMAGNKGNRWNSHCEVDFLLMKPKIAYSASRAKIQNKIQALARVLEQAHSYVEGWEHFKNFSLFVEGILAYHKYYGGKE